MTPSDHLSPRLDVLDHVPPQWLTLDAHALSKVVEHPTLIHLAGKRPEPLFVSTLLHGNETSGWDAIRRWLTRAAPQPSAPQPSAPQPSALLPRAVSLFIGNVYAAREGLRRFDDQPDYNRVWPIGEEAAPDSPEARIAHEVVEQMRARAVFAAVDMHNTTGRNPLYGITHSLDANTLGLAQFFSSRVLYADQKVHSCSQAFSMLCPSVTLEAGRSGEHAGISALEGFLQSCARLEGWADPADSVGEGTAESDDFIDELSVYRMVTRVLLDDGASISFDGSAADLECDDEVDRYNFQVIPAGTTLARMAGTGAMNGTGASVPLEFVGKHAIEDCVSVADGRVVSTRDLVPVMLTTDPRIVRQDCLCYLMDVVHL